MDVRQRCTNVFSKIMEVPLAEVKEESSPGTIESWDSLSHVQLISALEEEFKIEIPPEAGVDIEDFKGLVSFVETQAQ